MEAVNEEPSGGRARLVRWVAGRAVARTAIAGTALGIAALAALAVSASAVTAQATAQVRHIQAVTGVWNDISVRIDAEDAALREYLATGGTDYRRQQLDGTLDSARSDLDWLDDRQAVDRVELDVIRGAYANYSRILVDIVAMTSKGASVQGYSELASLAFAPLRDEVLDNVYQNQRQLGAYLGGVDRHTKLLRAVTVAVIPVDALLLGVCAVVLIGYQRRAERQAADRLVQATHDPLTGLGNRTMLRDRLRSAIGDSTASGDPFCLLLIDLDRFKEVNDTLGHACGDELLCGVADRLTSVSRSSDTVVRLGGDEFALVLANVRGREHALDVANRVLSAIRRPLELGGVLVDIDASIGVSMYPDDGEDAQQLLQHADVAMYAAKRTRVGVAGYDRESDEHSRSRLSLQSDLRRGIERGELVLHFQPKIALVNGRVTGAEALVRWQHPEHGLLSPDKFIPLAEQSGLIGQLTLEVLNQALRQVREWSDAGLPLSVSVNIPARSLADSGFPDDVIGALVRHGVLPEMLTLEVTESALITDPVRANEVLQRLREYRIDISIDDFGTGYSSIAHLRDMPPHELKIDRSFVMTMCEDPRDETIVRAVIDLAKNLCLRVVAEGVEDERAMRMLAGLGCDEAQGYHISRPLPAAVLTEWLLSGNAQVGTGHSAEPAAVAITER